MSAPGFVNYTGNYPAPPQDLISNDYSGSAQDWQDTVTKSLIERWNAGSGGLPGYGSGIGQPDPPTGAGGAVTVNTQRFWTDYVKQFGASDPWIVENYGPQPARTATYQPNPDAASSVTGQQEAGATDRARIAAETADKDRAAQIQIDAADNAARLEAARISAGASVQAAQIGADASIRNTQAQVAAQLQIATMQDATDRYIAEGNWGVQKYVAELQENGAMDRLKLQLAQDDKHLAQDALAENNRHQESMLNLALQVAQYDSQLAAEPRNWLAYAAWLGNRDIVVNGLTLAMAASTVPASAIDPGEVLQSTGSGIAAEQSAVAASQPNSGAQPSQVTTTATGQQDTNLQGGQASTQQPATTLNVTTGQGAPAGSTGVAGGQQVDLNSTDYTAIAKQLLGVNSLAPTSAPTTQQLQSVYDSLATTGGRRPGFAAYNGPTTNNLGVTVNPSGQKVDYRQFSNLLPAQQEMKVAADATSIGRYEPDYIQELQKSRPKGAVQGVSSYG